MDLCTDRHATAYLEPRPLSVKVHSVSLVTSRVKLYELGSVDGAVLPPYLPGAHVRIPVKDKYGTPGHRSYSLIDAYEPGRPYRIAVQLEVGGTGGSLHIHEHLARGAEIEIAAPANYFEIEPTASKHVFIAGGIGITPIMSMAQWAVSQGADFALHYCARSQPEMAFEAEIAESFGDRATLYFDGGDPTRGIDCKSVLPSYEAGVHIYVCGPGGLIKAVREAARQAGWPDTAIHSESFAAASLADSRELSVRLAKSGITLLVAPNESILEVMLRAGVETYHDCRVGECGSCVVDVIQGEPLHYDFFLSDRERAEGKQICVCVSRAKSRELVLDI